VIDAAELYLECYQIEIEMYIKKVCAIN